MCSLMPLRRAKNRKVCIDQWKVSISTEGIMSSPVFVSTLWYCSKPFIVWQAKLLWKTNRFLVDAYTKLRTIVCLCCSQTPYSIQHFVCARTKVTFCHCIAANFLTDLRNLLDLDVYAAIPHDLMEEEKKVCTKIPSLSHDRFSKWPYGETILF